MHLSDANPTLAPVACPGHTRVSRRVLLRQALATPFAGLALMSPPAQAGVNLFKQTYDVSKDELQQRVQSRFPWKRSQGMLATLELTRPVLSLDPSNNRLRLAMQLTLSSQMLDQGSSLSGVVNTSSALRYLRDSRSLALDQPHVEQLDLAELPAFTAQPLSRMAALVVRDALDGQVIHSFKPDDLKVAWKAIEPTGITVTPDGLSLAWRWA